MTAIWRFSGGAKMAIPFMIMAALPAAVDGQANVLTWHNDKARTGQNLQETILTPANVKPSTFGKLFVLSVQGKVDAQPLYVSGVDIPALGRSYNVLYVVTEHDLAYAFDADSGSLLWSVSLLAAGETPSDDRSCSQVTPEIGITATPVIDPLMGRSGLMYVVAMSKDASSNYHQRLHALDLRTGAEQLGGPVEIHATFPGTGAEGSNGIQTFDPKQHEDRAGLVMVNGVVYTSWSSHCDHGPYTSWVIGYNAATLAQASVLNLIPNGSDGGIWGAGAAPAADAAGNLFLLTGNGTFDTALNPAGFPSAGDYGNAVVKMSTRAGLAVSDYFTMSNTVNESNTDEDLGSGGVMLVPPVTDSQGSPRGLAVGAGKDRNIYVVDQANMGKFHTTDTLYQEMVRGAQGQLFSSPAWFNGTLYYASNNNPIMAFTFANGGFAPTPASSSTFIYGYPGATPSISANGTSNGIVWTAENADPAVLLAHDAGNLSTELYDSNQAANGRDHFGVGNKFIVPTVVNGKVYVGTTNGVGVLGLLCSYAPAPQSMVIPGAGGPQTIALTATAGCAWTATSNASWLTITSGSSGTGNGAVQFTASANPSSTPRMGTLTVADHTFTVTQTGPVTQPTSAPLGLSLSTTSGSGSSQTFSAVFWHFNGYSNLDWGQVMLAVAPDGGGQRFCLVHYDSVGNGLYLYGDGGFFLGPVTPGASSNVLDSSACTVNTLESSVAKSGQSVTVNVAVSFKGAFMGSKNVYLRAAGGSATGFVAGGTWTVTAPASGAMTIAPASGSGSAQPFTATFADPPSFSGQAFGWEQMLFAVAASGGGQAFCLVHYDRVANTLWLLGDNGSYLGPISIGSVSTALQNSACAIDTLNSSTLNLPSGLQLTVAVSFKAAFTGVKNVYLRQRDVLGGDSGFQTAGTWTVSSSGAAAWAQPTAGSGASQIFNATYYHPNGTGSLKWAQLLLATAPDGGGQPFCLVHYDRIVNGLYLYGDNGVFLGPVTPGASSSILHNSFCAIDTTGSSVSVSGGFLAVNVSVSFQGSFHGRTNTYLRALDINSQDTGLQQRGAWTIP